VSYTLVQHTAFSVGGNPQFKAAVEERSLSTQKQVRAVERAGGLVFKTYSEAHDAAFNHNYPPGVEGLIPQAKGKFVSRAAVGEAIFIPEAA